MKWIESHETRKICTWHIPSQSVCECYALSGKSMWVGRTVTLCVLRHTTAVHLLQAGADLSLIALWLGHESIESTQAYVDSDLTYKRRILDNTVPIGNRNLLFRPDDDLMAFLQDL